MERVKQALERAGLGRTAKSGVLVSDVVSELSPGIQRRITYTSTRVIPVSVAECRRNNIIVGVDDPYTLTAYNMLRTQVLQRLQENGWNSLAVVSANSGNGATLTAINLAISMAREIDKTVLLVDLNLQQPRICNYFGCAPEYGVADYLLREVPLEKMLFNPGVERLVVLPGVGTVTNSAELLASEKMGQLVRELKQRYPSRIVMFDLPPLLAAADAMAFSPYVEAALLVVADGETSKNDVNDALLLMKATNVLGAVLNRHKAPLKRVGGAGGR